MHLPRPSPPFRGRLLTLVARLSGKSWARRLLLEKVRRDALIPEMPDLTRGRS